LIAHPRSQDVVALIQDEGTLAASSELTIAELHRLAARIPVISARAVDDVLDRIDLVALTAPQLRAAGLLPDLPSGAQLRSLDAIHLQAALDFGAHELVTSDRRQAQAATNLNVRVTLV
jgi:predicted nucleic acid-binding protein